MEDRVSDEKTPRVPFDVMRREFRRVLLKIGFTEADAKVCAAVFAENSLDGVASHGLNRFPGFVRAVMKGVFRVDAKPVCVNSFGAWEQWDGGSGIGPLNALACTERALELARTHGVGCVGLRHTNHWMRGGTYGWKAAERGFAFICWTNTMPLMPPWGAAEKRIGNNPLVLAVPRTGGPVVLDMVMSQFSNGKLGIFSQRNEPLPVVGGFDSEGNPTRDAAAILRAGRPLPIGCWKGAGLALLLDLMAATLSGGLTTSRIGAQGGEFDVSQVFIALDPSKAFTSGGLDQAVNAALDDMHRAAPISEGSEILHPGERTLRRRRENLANGVPVDAEIWQTVLSL